MLTTRIFVPVLLAAPLACQGGLGLAITFWSADFDVLAFSIPSSSDGIRLVIL